MINSKPRPSSGQKILLKLSLNLLLAILFILALALRLAPAGRYVTPDEPAWVYRAIRFSDALLARNWSDIPVTGHPGVTTMWLGTLGVTVQRILSPAESGAQLDWIRNLAWLAPENSEAFHRLASFLPWGRLAVALTTTLGLVFLYRLLRRLFNWHTALLTAGLLACDPFLTGHSGLLHTDALLATFSLLALAATLNGVIEPRRARWWALAGFFTGLALLTKTPALILLPFISLVQIIAHFRKPQANLQSNANHRSFIGNISLAIVHWVLFALVIAGTCFALYPALWTDAADTIGALFGFAEQHIEMAQRPIFFMGEMTYDPGPSFYPTVLLFRISPIVLVGLGAGLATLRRMDSERRIAFLLMLVFAICLGVLMNQAAKRHDRYLLPAMPPLTLAAALGIEALFAEKPARAVRQITIISVQALIALVFLFHPLTYANLLVGGPGVASQVFSIDWGEGAGAAAHWLNQQPHADQLTVAASIPIFAPLFNGRTVPLERATQADYIVLDSSQPTNQLTNNHLSSQPAATIKFGFTDHAAVYTNTAIAQQVQFLTAQATPADLIVLAADTPLRHHYTGPGDIISIADLPTRAAVAERLAKSSNNAINDRAVNDHAIDNRAYIWLVADPAAAPITAARLRQEIELNATPVSTATVGSAAITQYAYRQSPIGNHPASIASFGDHLVLVDALLPTTAITLPFTVHLRWKISTPSPTDLHTSIYLRDAADHLWSEVGQIILNDVTFPTSAWHAGEWADTALTVSLPEHIPPGIYNVQLTVTDDTGAQLGARDGTGAFVGVRVVAGSVEIAPPDEPTGLAACEPPDSRASIGDLVVCVPELLPQAVPSGDCLLAPLIWSAVSVPRGDYNVRWRLLDSADSVVMEQIEPLSPHPTSRWRAGDSFESLHDLCVAPLIPAGIYDLTLNALTPDGYPTWRTDETLTSIHVLSRDRLFDLPDDIAYPLDLTLGQVIHLRGFDVSPLPRGEGAGVRAHPGESLPLTLYWQGDGPTDIDCTVFVHLIGPDEQPHGQVDQYPDAGAAPTTSWAPGQVIVDAIELPIAADAPAGTYRIAVGMYDVNSGYRLPVTDAKGNRLPDDRIILPVEIAITGEQ